MPGKQLLITPPRTTRRSAAAASNKEEDDKINSADDEVAANLEGDKNKASPADKKTASSAEDGTEKSPFLGKRKSAPTATSDAAEDVLAKKKRLCRHPGCSRVIKSQGHCQRHGAKAKRCKVEGCEKQAQVRT
jgi:hypothetical protein